MGWGFHKICTQHFVVDQILYNLLCQSATAYRKCGFLGCFLRLIAYFYCEDTLYNLVRYDPKHIYIHFSFLSSLNICYITHFSLCLYMIFCCFATYRCHRCIYFIVFIELQAFIILHQYIGTFDYLQEKSKFSENKMP